MGTDNKLHMSLWLAIVLAIALALVTINVFRHDPSNTRKELARLADANAAFVIERAHGSKEIVSLGTTADTIYAGSAYKILNPHLGKRFLKVYKQTLRRMSDKGIVREGAPMIGGDYLIEVYDTETKEMKASVDLCLRN